MLVLWFSGYWSFVHRIGPTLNRSSNTHGWKPVAKQLHNTNTRAIHLNSTPLCHQPLFLPPPPRLPLSCLKTTRHHTELIIRPPPPLHHTLPLHKAEQVWSIVPPPCLAIVLNLPSNMVAPSTATMLDFLPCPLLQVESLLRVGVYLAWWTGNNRTVGLPKLNHILSCEGLHCLLLDLPPCTVVWQSRAAQVEG